MRTLVTLASPLLLLPLLVVVVGCGDDDPMLTDSAVSDTGTTDTGTSDTGTADSATMDTGTADTGMPDTGPPTCDPTASGITFPSREWNAEVVAEGAEVNEPVGLDWNAAGVLLFSNSQTWIGTGTDPGNVLEDDGGTLGVFAMDDLMTGPAFVAWNAGDPSGFDEGLYLGTEDGAGAAAAESVLKVSADGTSVELFVAVEEPGELEFGRGDFGSDLYVTSRERTDASTPNPYEVYRIAPDGAKTRFAMMDGATTINGAFSLEFGPGGALGEDLFVGTQDDPGFSPGSMNAIYRVRASDGESTLFATDIRPVALAAPAVGNAEFGEHLYVVTANAIVRYDPTGTEETFAEGLMSSAALRFAPDGSLYLAQPGASRIIRITPCP